MASSGRWIRLNVGWEDSAWLDALDGTAAGCWPRLLCLVKLAGVGGVLKAPSLVVLARKWRVSVMSIQSLVDAAVADGALVADGGDWIVTNWRNYQEYDATSKDRSKRYRQSKHRLSPSRVTPRDTVSSRPELSMSMSSKDTGTNQSTRSRKISLPADWQPNEKHHAMAIGLNVDAAAEATKMRDWALAKGERRVDWDAQFRNWLKQAKPVSGAMGQTDELEEVKLLIKAGGVALLDPWAKEHGFEKAAKAHPALWQKHEQTFRKIRFHDLKGHIETRNGYEYTQALKAQIKEIHAAA